jgi:hypothetical protein
MCGRIWIGDKVAKMMMASSASAAILDSLIMSLHIRRKPAPQTPDDAWPDTEPTRAGHVTAGRTRKEIAAANGVWDGTIKSQW